ncbi:MAG: cytochrome-c oxidase, cbb3-type subunit I [Ignavibacterium sp.]|nr:cytochrome-c oxidase, cbb3-type subunit I [Ignavibacterium sp.]MCX7611475.1 cytochrome-c oxidase, cbb3-type subunit I [Ignavibacterium sp.]MDW8374545.1 cytochrome-c oxidase, cbb3-type subunit I [Ignavibacteriales bacterium]
MELERFSYDNKIVRNFAYATILWGVVGMVVGLLIAFQLFIPELSFSIPYLTFGRIRPLHTNAVIFAFVGNAIFMGVYYSLPRLLKTQIFSKTLSSIHFWGWQLIIVAAAITLPLGITTSKEYSELEWPIDIAITLVWVAFGINMIGTIIKRRESHIFVAIWFYIATWVTVAILHIVNSLEIPVTFLKSYSLYAGVQDALVQWWYGHNAVAFFLTTSYLGLMYYYLPKAANRPVYSYKLSILHFWTLIFIYIWAGPHHLLYTALPDWAQSLGTVFSVMLIAPSWGGMINGLLTLRGAWDRVRQDPVLKFMVVAVTAYGMATFEGPTLSLKNVNAIAHYTDWVIAHVHIGALGWNGFLTFGILYWLIPKLWRTDLYSKKLANVHFWIGFLGIVFYALPMWFSGITQALMWKQFDNFGVLQYPNFLETVLQIIPMYIIRGIAGAFYVTGVILMVYNLIKTIKKGSLLEEEFAEAPPLKPFKDEFRKGLRHRWLEGKPIYFTIASLVVVLIGGIIEFVPMFLVKSNVPTIASVKPYTPLELQGRDIYIREACNSCHSQLVRPFRSETERYGEYSKAGEYVYDHPFLWGSKRSGPDLHRIGGKYPNSWHYLHMENPRSTSPGSTMPPYPWLLTNDLDNSTLEAKINALRKIGVPYPEGYEKIALAELNKQAEQITLDLQKNGVPAEPQKEIIALIAYLQRLGTDIKANKQTASK